jgi:dCTP deaminase
MSILSNQTIFHEVRTRHLGISPFNNLHVQPAGYDLTLDRNVLLWPVWTPWNRRLVHVGEHIIMPCDLQGEIFGRSSVARQWVLAHTVSGPLEPGWRGYLTLEMVNLSWGFRHYKKGDRVAQVKFSRTDLPAEPGYRGRYQEQKREPTASKFKHGDD